MELVIEKFHEKLYCQVCKGKTNHGIGFKYTESSYEDFQWEKDYYVTKCLGCDSIAFATEYGDESMVGRDEFGDYEVYTSVKVYPEEPKNEINQRFDPHILKEFNNTPDLIEMLYIQIVTAYNMKSYLLSAVGLRMMLDGICKDLNIKEGFVLNENGEKEVNNEGEEIRNRKLIGKINGLIEQGVIVQKQAAILHQIRELGNTTVHELEVPKRRTVQFGLDIIENMIHNIYELDKFKL